MGKQLDAVFAALGRLRPSAGLLALAADDVAQLTDPWCHALVGNNLDSGNVGLMLESVAARLAALPHGQLQARDMDAALAVVNGLFLIRTFVRFMIENLSPSEIALHVGDGAEAYVLALADFAADASRTMYLYPVYVEVLNSILVLLSTQLYHAVPGADDDEEDDNLALRSNASDMDGATDAFLNVLMSHDDVALRLTRTLLFNFFTYRTAASDVGVETARLLDDRGFIHNVASSAATVASSVILWPFHAVGSLFYAGAEEHGVDPSPVSSRSALLLNTLVTHVPAADVAASAENAARPPHLDAHLSSSSSGGSAASSGARAAAASAFGRGPSPSANPFFRAVRVLDDDFEASGGAHSADVEAGGGTSGAGLSISYARLFDAFVAGEMDDKTALLLYLLMHNNAHFLEYVHSRTDVDELVVPLLHLLYSADKFSAQQVTMLLIIILILSQDASFNLNVHTVTISHVSWFRERILQDISVGSLMVVVLVRTAQTALSSMRDIYSLAALANMAPHFHKLHSYAAQRVVVLFDMVARKYLRLHATPQPAGAAEREALAADLVTYEDFLRLILEIINAAVTYNLPTNEHLVYSLLYNQSLFESLKDHARFQDILENVQQMLNFFNARVRDAQQEQFSVDEISALIRDALKAWKADRVQMFPELNFKYEERENPQEFFVPYAWSLVYEHLASAVHWDVRKAVLLRDFVVAGQIELPEGAEATASTGGAAADPTQPDNSAPLTSVHVVADDEPPAADALSGSDTGARSYSNFQ